jgi:hypothetical protein
LGLNCTGYATISNPLAQGLLVSGWAQVDASAGSSTALTVKGGGSGTALSVTGGNITCSGDIIAGRNIQATTAGINSGVVTCLTLSAANKTFDIPHPTKAGLRLRHRCSESDKARLYYEFTLECTEGLTVQELPEWFEAMNAEPRVYCSPVRHFGQAWGEVVQGRLHITANSPGAFHVMLTGVRNDKAAVDEWDFFGVEHSKVAPQ